MSILRSTLRFLITAGLLLSLSTLSLFPRVMVGEAMGAVVSASAVSASAGNDEKPCCCGTKDARCCGMACCQVSPNPREKQAPEVPRSSEDRSQHFGLPAIADAALLAHDAASVREHLSQHPVCLNGASLIALSMRLNI